MTGEMSWIDDKGNDSNGETWDLHAKVAKAVKGKLKPFDVYQGPYIYVKNTRLWIGPAKDEIEGLLSVYNEQTEVESLPFAWNDTKSAIEAAKNLLTRSPK